MHDVQDVAAHKRLVVCCDGTGNRSDGAPTNVAKIALGVARAGPDGLCQPL